MREEEPRFHEGLPLQSTSEISPATSQRKVACALADEQYIPRVVIRHRIKGTKKAQKRIRKNLEQNKILLSEFKKSPLWGKSKIVELHQRLGLKESQIYKWNWDMLRKAGEPRGPAS